MPRTVEEEEAAEEEGEEVDSELSLNQTDFEVKPAQIPERGYNDHIMPNYGL